MATLLQEFLENEKRQISFHGVACGNSSWSRMERQQNTSHNSSCGSTSDATSICITTSTSSTPTTNANNAIRNGGSAQNTNSDKNSKLLPPAGAAATFLREEEELGVAVEPAHAEKRDASSTHSHGLQETLPSSLSSSRLPCSSSFSSCVSPAKISCPSSSPTSSSCSPLEGDKRKEKVDKVRGHTGTFCSVEQLPVERGEQRSSSSRNRTRNSSTIGNGDCSRSGENPTGGSHDSSERSTADVTSGEDAVGELPNSSAHTRNQEQQKQRQQQGQQKFSPSSSSSASSLPPSSSSSSSFSFPFVPCAAAASLPVLRHAEAIVEAVKQHPVTVILGETGSGKSTQIPQVLHAAGFAAAGVIGITQPRRVAAVSLAARVAQEVRARQKQQQQQQQQSGRQHQQGRRRQLHCDYQKRLQPTENLSQQRLHSQPLRAGCEQQHEKDEEEADRDRHGRVPIDEPNVRKQRRIARGEKERGAAEVCRCSSKEQRRQKTEVDDKQEVRAREVSGGYSSWTAETKRVFHCEERAAARTLHQSRCGTSTTDTTEAAAMARETTRRGGRRAEGEGDGGRVRTAVKTKAAAAPAGEAITDRGEVDEAWSDRPFLVQSSTGSTGGGRAAVAAACGSTRARGYPLSCARDEEAATARERGGKEVVLGGLVGYSVRFEDVSSKETKIKFLTDGLLLREAIGDPLLLQYSVIVIDEAHERSQRSDVLLGYVKLLLQQQRRDNLRLVVMSATLEAKKFLSFFSGARFLTIPGRSFPLEILHTTEPQDDYVEAALIAALQIHVSAGDGDILIFLPGQEDIEAVHALLLEKRRLLRAAAALATSRAAALLQRTNSSSNSSTGSTPQSSSAMAASSVSALQRAAATPAAVSAPLAAVAPEARALFCSPSISASSSCLATVSRTGGAAGHVCVRIGEQYFTQTLPLRDLVVCPLYAALPFEQQKAVFDPSPAGSRKIILATNIAETSITVQGIRYVIDTGLVKNKVVNHRSGIEALVVREISKESAVQRAGRAAREAPGSVYRLYTEETYEKFKTNREPEIVSSDLGQVYLELKALRIANPLEFPFLDPPCPEAFFNAGRTLHRIGALDARGDLTAVGRQLSALPLSPLLGKLLLESVRLGCTAEILTIVAMLSTDSLWSNSGSVSGPKTARLSDSRRQITVEQSDHLTLLNAYTKWREASDEKAFCREYGLHPSAMRRAAQIRQQLEELVKSPLIGAQEIKAGGSHDNWAVVRQCLAAGCWLNSARLQRDGISYVTTVQRLVAKLHPSSALFGKTPLPGYIVYSEYVQTTKPYLRHVTAIEGSWLQQLVPRWFSVVGNAV